MSASSLPPTNWDTGTFAWGAKTYVMAIINATPDSFSGDGIAESPDVAGDLAAAAVTNGADVIDIGAESTRPGHQPVSAHDELIRLLPVLEAVSTRVNVPISVDTSKARCRCGSSFRGQHSARIDYRSAHRGRRP